MRGDSHISTDRSRLSHARLSALMHIRPSKKTTETFDLWIETANRRLSQGQGDASAASSSSTMQETEAEEDSEEDCTY